MANKKLITVDVSAIADCMVTKYGYNHKDKFEGFSYALLDSLEELYAFENLITKELARKLQSEFNGSKT